MKRIANVVFVLCATLTISMPASAQTLTTLHSFDGTDGGVPSAGLIQGTNGDFYGTTLLNSGTVFRMTPSGTLTTIFTFDGTDGAHLQTALIEGGNGGLYGTTRDGGAGFGTVFKIAPGGSLTTLYNFCSRGGSSCTDGAYPSALLRATNGDFYGTTSNGGIAITYCNNGCGTIFRITPEGTLSTLHTFEGTDGFDPEAGLIQANDGNFYGTTAEMGNVEAFGTVFKITPTGALTTLAYFNGSSTGSQPKTALVQATNGKFYGTTEGGGGGNVQVGVVFAMTPNGALTMLYSSPS